METIILSRKKFEQLQPLPLEKTIYNTEGQLFIYEEKKGWKKSPKIVKKLYINEGDVFGNKLATVTSLISRNKELSEELDVVVPEKLVVVDKNLEAFTLPYIESSNFSIVLKDRKISESQKLEYFKQIGQLFEKMGYFRQYYNLPDFFLNDVHEANFIVDHKTNQIKAVDLDSCKINNNKPFSAKYLTPSLILSYLEPKYKPCYEEHAGYYYPDENTDLYCYCIMLLNYFFNGNISELSINEFYDYLQYLKDIGFPKEMVDIFSKLFSLENNQNPYQYIDEIPQNFMRANKNVFKHVRNLK